MRQLIRNYDPHFWEHQQPNANCGSFAFNVQNWFVPFEDEIDGDTLISDMIEEGYDENDIMDALLAESARAMESMMPDNLKQIKSYEINALAPDTTIVAYRLGLSISDCGGYDFDYHFKVRLNGEWWEKNGGYKAHPCELQDNEPWECSWNYLAQFNCVPLDKNGNLHDNSDIFLYTSPILYFIVRR